MDMPTGAGVPRSPAIKATPPATEANSKSESAASPPQGSTKAVSIIEPDSISPLMGGRLKPADPDEEPLSLDRSSPRQYRAKVGRRLSGRPSLERPSLERLHSRQSMQSDSPAAGTVLEEDLPPSNRSSIQYFPDGLFSQITAWIKQERARRQAKRAKRKTPGGRSADRRKPPPAFEEPQVDESPSAPRTRRSSDTSEGSAALEHLEAILQKSLHLYSSDHHGHKFSIRRRLSGRSRRRQSVVGSDTDFSDSEHYVPSCDVILDNTKTLAYSGGRANPDEDPLAPSRRALTEREAWATFNYEIVRLAHTLRLKGWRQVPMDQSNEIEVERLSGALTNAVYVVTPPRDLSGRATRSPVANGGASVHSPNPQKLHKPPQKLLLRIYGPQVEHLIDRENELQVLRRLARKRIGPRLLGTFTNGRFEEFLHARALTHQEIRAPETSKQIAKRMRELHDGIDLLPHEREDGPTVWLNWDKWVGRCEQVISWIDDQILSNKQGAEKTKLDAWKHRGLVCGVEWPVFRKMVEKYRRWLYDECGGSEKIKQRLVFSHNDAQYGNILRLQPTGESPLLLPSNEHRQLVVIDFEYASANVPGLEFANHFTEWCYNYHDAHRPYACRASLYPAPDEQSRFIRAYVRHRTRSRSTPSHTPSQLSPVIQPVSFSHISTFMLDSRVPRSVQKEEEAREEKETNEKVEEFMRETRIWRLANSAQWVAWGIVQAKVRGMPEDSPTLHSSCRSNSKHNLHQRLSPPQGANPLDGEATGMANDLNDRRTETKDYFGPDEVREKKESDEGVEGDVDEEFDYLGYAQDRAMFVWADAVALGMVELDELPQWVRKRVEGMGVKGMAPLEKGPK